MLLDVPLITSSRPIPSGALADIYEGILDGSKVCVKQPRTYSTYSDGDMESIRMVRSSLFSLAFPTQTGPQVFPGGCHVEIRETSQHRPLPGYC